MISGSLIGRLFVINWWWLIVSRWFTVDLMIADLIIDGCSLIVDCFKVFVDGWWLFY